MDVGNVPHQTTDVPCAQCGTPALLNATFCAQCGAPLPGAQDHGRLLTGVPFLDSLLGWLFVAVVILSPSIRVHHWVLGAESIRLVLVPFVFWLVIRKAAPAFARGVLSGLTFYALGWLAFVAWMVLLAVLGTARGASHNLPSISKFFHDPLKAFRDL